MVARAVILATWEDWARAAGAAAPRRRGVAVAVRGWDRRRVLSRLLQQCLWRGRCGSRLYVSFRHAGWVAGAQPGAGGMVEIERWDEAT